MSSGFSAFAKFEKDLPGYTAPIPTRGRLQQRASWPSATPPAPTSRAAAGTNSAASTSPPKRNLQGNWRATAGPQSPSPPVSPSRLVPNNNWLVGDIAFLGIPDKNSPTFQFESHLATFGHPALVFSTDVDPDFLWVMTITSLGGRPLKEKLERTKLGDRYNVEWAHVPIKTEFDSRGDYAHPDRDMPVLVLKDNGEMDKISYLRRDKLIKVEKKWLSAFTRDTLQMEARSMAELRTLHQTRPIVENFY